MIFRKLLVLIYLLCLFRPVMAQPSYITIVEKASLETGVPAYIIMGVILAESSGNPPAFLSAVLMGIGMRGSCS